MAGGAVTVDDVIRGRRVGAWRLLRCALTITLANTVLQPREWVTRWRRTSLYALLVAVPAAELIVIGVPWGLALLIGLLVMPAALTLTGALQIHFGLDGIDDMWHVCDGRSTALILTAKRTHPGRILHSWSAWPRGHGLGGLVAAHALAQAPRPFWVDAATPELRDLYIRRGGHPDPPGRWIVFSDP